jgi:tRNA 2-thiouridine synthesizing protein E
MNTTHFAEYSGLDTQVANLSFDDDGFLLDPKLWNEGAAKMIAQIDGIGDLTTEHWAVIRVLRDLYLRLGAIPPMRRICRDSALSRDQVKGLFGSCRQVWRIAGLPHPGDEALAYMS